MSEPSAASVEATKRTVDAYYHGTKETYERECDQLLQLLFEEELCRDAKERAGAEW